VEPVRKRWHAGKICRPIFLKKLPGLIAFWHKNALWEFFGGQKDSKLLMEKDQRWRLVPRMDRAAQQLY